MKAVIYSKPNCPNCVQAKTLLSVRNIEYTEVSIGEDITREEFFSLFPEARTVPQIILDEKHIGGFQELTKLI